jgi:putative YphP/YqiW family bacilliredoxin
MPYPEPLVAPMRAELSAFGVKELRTSQDVDQAFADTDGKTMLLIVNSVCGCAAANARPAVRMSLQSPTQPDSMVTVFAGQDMDATATARQYLAGIPPSSPFMALLKDGDPVFVLERRNIEGRSASAIATDLVGAYQKFCGKGEVMGVESTGSETIESGNSEDMPSTFRSIL